MTVSNQLVEEIKIVLGLQTLPLFWTESDLDKYGIRSKTSSRRDRVKGGGIPFVKHKGQVKYSVHDVICWLQSNKKNSTSES